MNKNKSDLNKFQLKQRKEEKKKQIKENNTNRKKRLHVTVIFCYLLVSKIRENKMILEISLTRILDRIVSSLVIWENADQGKYILCTFYAVFIIHKFFLWLFMDSYDNKERHLTTVFASLLHFVMVSEALENETDNDSFFFNFNHVFLVLLQNLFGWMIFCTIVTHNYWSYTLFYKLFSTQP